MLLLSEWFCYNQSYHYHYNHSDDCNHNDNTTAPTTAAATTTTTTTITTTTTTAAAAAPAVACLQNRIHTNERKYGLDRPEVEVGEGCELHKQSCNSCTGLLSNAVVTAARAWMIGWFKRVLATRNVR